MTRLFGTFLAEKIEVVKLPSPKFLEKYGLFLLAVILPLSTAPLSYQASSTLFTTALSLCWQQPNSVLLMRYAHFLLTLLTLAIPQLVLTHCLVINFLSSILSMMYLLPGLFALSIRLLMTLCLSFSFSFLISILLCFVPCLVASHYK